MDSYTIMLGVPLSPKLRVIQISNILKLLTNKSEKKLNISRNTYIISERVNLSVSFSKQLQGESSEQLALDKDAT